MLLTIHYFASIRESLGKDGEQLELPMVDCDVKALIAHLKSIDSQFDSLLGGENKILIAVNQTVVTQSHVLNDQDEVAFFPPMTGG